MDRKPEKYNRYLKETAFIDLNPEHRDAFHSLYKSIVDVNGFQLIILQFNDPRYRDRLIAKTASIGKKSRLIRLDNKTYPTFHDFEEEIERLAQKATVINVVNLENWLFAKDVEKRITGFNYHRESLAESCAAALLLWMTEPDIKAFALGAPDMWAWRSAVLDFNITKERAASEHSEDRPYIDGLLLRGKVDRINEIKAFLEKEDKETSGKLKASLLDELGRLYFSIGKNDEAIRYFEESLEIFPQIKDKRGEGTTLNNISQIFKARGDIETALPYLEQSLSIRREIGDKSGEGTTLNNISGIYRTRGDTETALSYLEQSLKISREIGDKSGEIPTLHNMASITLNNDDTQKAFEYEAAAYKLALETGGAMGLYYVGKLFGRLLFSAGKKEEGITVLKRTVKIGKESQLPGVEKVEQILQNLMSQQSTTNNDLAKTDP